MAEFKMKNYVLLVFLLSTISITYAQKFEARMDVGFQMTYGITDDLDKMNDKEVKEIKDAYKVFFLDGFELGVDAVRLALVQTSTRFDNQDGFDTTNSTRDMEMRVAEKAMTDSELHKVTIDKDRLTNAIYGWQPTVLRTAKNVTVNNVTHDDYTYYRQDTGRAMVQLEKIFDASVDPSKPPRARVMIMLVTSTGDSVQSEAIGRRKKDVYTYAVGYKRYDQVNTDTRARQVVTFNEHFRSSTDGRLQIIETKKGDEVVIEEVKQTDLLAAFKKLIEPLRRDLCGWEGMCRYSEPNGQGQCIWEVWSNDCTYFNDKAKCEKECGDLKPPNQNCTMEMCKETCDRNWPWDGRRMDCGTSCGSTNRKSTYLDEEVGPRAQQRLRFADKLKMYCDEGIDCSNDPRCKEPEPPEEPAGWGDEEAQSSLVWSTSLLGLLLAIVIIAACAIAAIIVIFYRRSQRARQHEFVQINRLQEQVNNMSMYFQTAGAKAETGLAADLPSVRQDSVKPKVVGPVAKKSSPTTSGKSGKSEKSGKK